MVKIITEKDIFWAKNLMKDRKLSDTDIICKIWERAYARALKNMYEHLKNKTPDQPKR